MNILCLCFYGILGRRSQVLWTYYISSLVSRQEQKLSIKGVVASFSVIPIIYHFIIMCFAGALAVKIPHHLSSYWCSVSGHIVVKVLLALLHQDKFFVRRS